MPLFGWAMSKVLFAYMLGPDYDDGEKTMRSELDFWILMIVLEGVVVLIACFGKISMFGIVGENITLNIRTNLY